MASKLFAQMVLPVHPGVAVDGADIRLVEMADEAPAREAFFGGYAEDFLADLGFDAVEVAPEATARKAKRIQG